MILRSVRTFLFCCVTFGSIATTASQRDVVDGGFIDDFFTRFPELPFNNIHPAPSKPGNDAYYKTLYNMHKNRRGPGEKNTDIDNRSLSVEEGKELH